MTGRRKLKVTIVGAASANFGPALLYDLLDRVGSMLREIALVDINVDALELIAQTARKMIAFRGLQTAVRADTQRRSILENSDFVFISAEKDRISAWRKDWEIPQRFGINHTLGENRGPGGVSHALRTIPLVLSVCRDMEELCPSAYAVVLTNPEDRIAYAIERYTSIRAYGYCDGLWDFKDRYAGKLLSIPGNEIHLHGCGINHAVWIQQLVHIPTGRDIYRDMGDRSVRQDWQPLGRYLWENYGLWPHENDEHYGEYFPFAAEFFAPTGYDFDQHEHEMHVWRQRQSDYAAGTVSDEEFMRLTGDFCWHVLGDQPPSQVIEGIGLGIPTYLQNANIVNHGKIRELPDDMIVELPAVATIAGIFGVQLDRLPDLVLSFLWRESQIQRLVAEAAVEANRRKAILALAQDSHVNSPQLAEELLDAFLEAHGPLMDDRLGTASR